VGHGFAGLSAAASFLESSEGREPRVAVLDRASFADRGGSTAWTTASFRLNDEGHLTKDWGEYVRNTGGDRANEGYIDSFYANLDDTLDWVRSHGVETRVLPNALLPGMFASHHNSLAHGGKDFVEHYTELVARLGGTFFYEVDLLELEREPAGPVTAVRVRVADGTERRLETKAVVLASGGFEGDKEELGRRIPGGETLDTVSVGTRVNTGAGIKAAVAIGAAKAGQYDGTHLEPVDARDPGTEPLVGTWLWGVIVDPGGQRFLDEAETAFDIQFDWAAKKILARGGRAFAITDASVRASVPMFAHANSTQLGPITGNNVRELAEKLEIDPAALEQTISAYNAASNDRPFDPMTVDGKRTEGLEPPKSNWAQPLTEGPFEAWPLKAQICFTFEGLKVDATTHVVDEQGELIPGLHAAGEIVGIFYGDIYPAGSSGLRSMTFGRLAGQDVAAELKTAAAV
jgi:tricarballylate dehydrogenase